MKIKIESKNICMYDKTVKENSYKINRKIKIKYFKYK